MMALALALFVASCSPPHAGFSASKGPKKIGKLVSLSPSTTELVGALGLTRFLSGRTSSCDHPFDVKDVPVVVDGTKPDYERLAAIKPQAIFFDSSLYGASDIEKMRETGATLYELRVATIDGLLDFILETGADLGVPSAASEVADKLFAEREAARAKAPARKVRVAVLMPGTGDMLAAGQGSLMADIVKECGGELVGPEGDKYVMWSPEWLIKADPEIILTEPKGAAKILADARMSAVAAVRAKPAQVYEVDGSYLYRATNRIGTLLDQLSSRIANVGNK